MRRLRDAAALAAYVAVPALAHAQAPQSFVIRGCADDAVIAYTGTGTAARPVIGRLACFFGTGVLAPGAPFSNTFVFDGGLNTTLGTDQTRRLTTELAPTLTLTSPRSAPVQAGTASFFSSVAFANDSTTPLRAYFYVPPGTAPGDYTGGSLYFYATYSLDDNPRLGIIPTDNLNSTPVRLTVTATPEPVPLALTAVALGGVAVLGTGAGRRRRTGSA